MKFSFVYNKTLNYTPIDLKQECNESWGVRIRKERMEIYTNIKCPRNNSLVILPPFLE